MEYSIKTDIRHELFKTFVDQFFGGIESEECDLEDHLDIPIHSYGLVKILELQNGIFQYVLNGKSTDTLCFKEAVSKALSFQMSIDIDLAINEEEAEVEEESLSITKVMVEQTVKGVFFIDPKHLDSRVLTSDDYNISSAASDISDISQYQEYKSFRDLSFDSYKVYKLSKGTHWKLKSDIEKEICILNISSENNENCLKLIDIEYEFIDNSDEKNLISGAEFVELFVQA